MSRSSAKRKEPSADPIVPLEVKADEAKADEAKADEVKISDAEVDDILDALVGPIAELPPEGTGAPAFQALSPELLAEFPPPPPLVLPTQAEAAPAEPPVEHQNSRGGVFPQAPVHAYEVTQGIRSTPPVIVDTKPEEPPPPNWDNLPERTRAELEMGRKQVGGTQPLSEAIIPRPAPGVRSNVPEEPSAPEPAVDLSKLSEQTRAELRAGAEALAKRNADYRAVLKSVADRNSDRLEQAAPAAPGDMDYNTR
jgi:hypothetical protein